ncbi:Uma2 family endonuclease [Pseudoalteromonas sp. DL2-H2.2]|uniref:Uma2 family endonuclease n=1 Tax=Pseudoalteromonas sp. DL2-H2.2 TaxID=2908889 RepID=UPI001F40F203|nr:Uma2 family endonuclease [Pseudoalteromonas sp. DL2-H2.2]MCF2908912.1 Uma2 family endonuclease [Pseudoalteromonas sp. DL2-H2.2]
MPIEKQNDILSPDSYLQGELTSTTKHELIDGQVYAMAGASANHERIAGNIYSELRSHLKGEPCEPFGSDMKVRVRDNFYYPDVLVDCHFDESEPYYTQGPVIIVEVLSRSTRKMDEKTKLIEYLNIPSLQEYVVIEQDVADVTVYRKSDDWRSTHYFLGEEIHFDSIDFTIAVEDIYLRVQNEDVQAYLAEQNAQ